MIFTAGRLVLTAAAVTGIIDLVDATKIGREAYDYIIVGGGTAGAALATRLSQSLKHSTILLIEAGPSAPDELRINVPAMFGTTQGTIYDWNFTTTKQPGVNDRELPISRAKVLGGSSAMNYMVWNRASTAEYDVWESLGNPGWNWDSILAGMIKSENFTGLNSTDYGDIGRGLKGPISNVVSRYRTEQVRSWVPTMGELGIPHNLESLAGKPLGAMLQSGSYNPDDYTRSYSANSYIPRAKSNLDTLLSTRVAKVNFESRSKRIVRGLLDRSTQQDLVATGVTLLDGRVLHANREVILSAGAIQSPGLLELSGIGRKSVLDTAGIKQILDIPGVGENFQDHVGIPVSFRLKPGYHSLDILRYNTTYAAEQLALWKAAKVSRYDVTFNAIAFLNWPQLAGNDSELVALAYEALGDSSNVIDQTKLSFLSNYSVPQMELILGDGTLSDYPAMNDSLYGADFVTLIAVFMRPLSRGSVHIASSSLSQAPTINPQYLSSQYDVHSLVEAGKYLRKIANTAPLSDFLLSEYQPGPATTNTDEEWAAYTRESLFSIYHYSGTCAMLPKKDGGVVDSRLKVHGTKNLRVVDVSITPVLIGSHTQTIAYGIAEVAADIITKNFKAT